MIAGVAAGHPATADAGAEILADGGSAADAAVAACLASGVAETVMTGLLGGGFALYVDSARGTVRNLDCFVTVPTDEGGPMERLQVPFGEELVHYAIGAASCAVPGLPAGLDLLWREHGRRPWPRLVEPALRLARDGVPMPAAHAAGLRMLAPVMTMREGEAIFAPGGHLLAEGELLRQPGLVAALELVRDEGIRTFYSGTIANALLALMAERGGAVSAADLAGYEAVWTDPVEVAFSGRRLLTRDGLASVPRALARFDPAGGPAALLAALEPPAS